MYFNIRSYVIEVIYYNMNETFHSDVQIDGQLHRWTNQQTDGQEEGQLNKQGDTLHMERHDRQTDRYTDIRYL